MYLTVENVQQSKSSSFQYLDFEDGQKSCSDLSVLLSKKLFSFIEVIA
jgi:hypothetical protein